MGNYYITSLDTWKKEVEDNERIQEGIEMLRSVDYHLDNAFQHLESDKYGLMNTYSYDKMTTKIERCIDLNNAQLFYARTIHDIIKEKDEAFFIKMNKDFFEEISLLNINEFTTKNTMGITETKTELTSTYHPDYGSQNTYETVTKEKANITLSDIHAKSDTRNCIAYLKEAGEFQDGDDIQEAKEAYYTGIYTTSFDHTVHVSDGKKGWWEFVGYIPVVGGFVDIIEGASGYTMTGEKLTDDERFQEIAFGTVFTIIDVFTIGVGTASSIGIKAVKEIGEVCAKQLGKEASKKFVQETVEGLVFTGVATGGYCLLNEVGVDPGLAFMASMLIGSSGKFNITPKEALDEVYDGCKEVYLKSEAYVKDYLNSNINGSISPFPSLQLVGGIDISPGKLSNKEIMSIIKTNSIDELFSSNSSKISYLKSNKAISDVELKQVQVYLQGVVSYDKKYRSLNEMRLAIQKGELTKTQKELASSIIKELGEVTDFEATMMKMNFKKYLTTFNPDILEELSSPHAHHIVYKKGLGKKQKQLVAKGQEILRKYDIDPIIGEDNFVWANL